MWTASYIALIALVNWGFAVLPMIPTPWGPLSPLSFVVGLGFTVRDLAQREIGHRVLFATAAGVALSYVMASPQVATASAVAFAVAELADYAVFTVLRGKTLRERMVWSNLVGCPLDTAVFLAGIGFLSLPGFLVMTESKLLALVVVPVLAPEKAP